MAKVQLNWMNVDITELPKPLKQAWQDYEEAKAEFERLFILASQRSGQLPADKTLAFSYRHGSLGIAITSGAKARSTFKLGG